MNAKDSNSFSARPDRFVVLPRERIARFFVDPDGPLPRGALMKLKSELVKFLRKPTGLSDGAEEGFSLSPPEPCPKRSARAIIRDAYPASHPHGGIGMHKTKSVRGRGSRSTW